MKKRILFFILTILTISLGGAYLYFVYINTGALPSFVNTHTTNKKYIIEKAGKVIDKADTRDEAINKASQTKRSIAINTYNGEWVYSDFNPFLIITENAVHDFDDLKEAILYAKKNEYTQVFYKNKDTIIWEADKQIINEVCLNVPLVQQLPELPRGCEVSSLAMIMQYAGVEVDKMELAKKIKKETTPYTKQGDKIHCGDPYNGFVGDMYNKNAFGYGVYHEPIAKLAREYLGNKVVNLTELEFEDILHILQKGYPIWIITNAEFRPLDDSQFEIWYTPTGIVKITYRLHAVVITGVKDDKIYINDPLSTFKNKEVNREELKGAWEQMGNQAIAILK